MIEDFIQNQEVSTPQNCIIPGLQSLFLVGAKVRVLNMTCEQLQQITPHSHRFDFVCYVVRGAVINTIFTESYTGHHYCKTEILLASGEMGDYAKGVSTDGIYESSSTRYGQGKWYSMKADEIHSITFSDDAIVLFIEGANKSPKSVVLEPIVDGHVVPIFKTEPWMFTS